MLKHSKDVSAAISASRFLYTNKLTDENFANQCVGPMTLLCNVRFRVLNFIKLTEIGESQKPREILMNIFPSFGESFSLHGYEQVQLRSESG